MRKRRLQNRQKLSTSLRMRIVIGASVFALASLIMITVFYLGDVQDSKAFIEGDYRTVNSGDWEDAGVWESFNGEDWQPAESAPPKGVQTITVSSGNKLTLYDEVILNELVIDENAELDILTNSIKLNKKNGSGGIVCNGTLRLHDVIVDGSGDFTLSSKGVLMIGSDAGIDKKGKAGNIQLKGKKSFDKQATYIFNGNIKQHTGDALPGLLENIVIDNSSGVELDQSFTVSKKLHVVKGVLTTGKNEIVVGQSVNNRAELKVENGSIMGRLKYWYEMNDDEFIDLPLSDGNIITVCRFVCDVLKYKKGLMELYFKPGIPDDNSRSPYEARHVILGITTAGYYSVSLTNGPEEAWLKLVSTNVKKGESRCLLEWNISSRNEKSIIADTDKPIAAEKNFSNLFAGPLPFNNILVVRFHSNNEESAFLALMNGSGKVVKNEKIKAVNGYNQVVLEVPKSISGEEFTLQLSSTSEIQTMKVVRTSNPSGSI